MRLKIDFKALNNGSYGGVDKHMVQSFIYNLLRGTEFDNMHNKPRFKFFTFSDIFPPSDFKKGEIKSLIISSPNAKFIKVLKESVSEIELVQLGQIRFEIHNYKIYKLNITNKFRTGSPVVIYLDNRNNIYFSFQKHGGLKFFLNRITENALKKYEAYYGRSIKLDGPLFDILEPRVRNNKVDVAIVLSKNGKKFLVIGTTWKLLMREYISPRERKLYEFIMDCGIGEKNSLGFGFLNPVRDE